MHAKGRVFRFFSVIIYVLIFIISILGIWYGSNTISYLNKSFNNNNVEVLRYNVVVLKESKYKNILDITSKKIGYVDVGDSEYEYLSLLKKKVKANYSGYDISKLYNYFMDFSS